MRWELAPLLCPATAGASGRRNVPVPHSNIQQRVVRGVGDH